MSREKRITLERTPAQIKVARLLAELSRRAMTIPEIADFLFLTPQVVRAYLKVLKERNEVHIKRWTTDAVAGLAGRPRPAYVAGPGKDATRPPKTRYAAHKRWYAKLKKDPVRYEQHLAKCRARHHRRKFKPHADVAAQWLFREAA